jgi:metal-responsive CopG/Arc/MetJ family transcriptional regulator
MRTSIDLPNSLCARLLELAAKRGEKGFSRLVREAIESYLAGVTAKERARRSAVDALGSLPEVDAERLEESLRHLRDRWR